jgi:hypothetical protein
VFTALIPVICALSSAFYAWLQGDGLNLERRYAQD